MNWSKVLALSMVLMLSLGLLSGLTFNFTGLVRATGQNWLNGWNYRKELTIQKMQGAGLGYQIQVDARALEVPKISATNAPNPSISATGHEAENMVYDNVTGLYWWVCCDRTRGAVGLAYSPSPTGPWTLQSTDPVTAGSGYIVDAPCLAKFGNYWYLYYGNGSSTSSGWSIWAERSTVVNASYSTVGINNPILTPIGGGAVWDGGVISEPYVCLINSTYYLFYVGENATTGPTTHELCGYATSSSPTGGFIKYSNNPIVGPGTHGWDSGLDCGADAFVFQVGSTYFLGVTGGRYGHSTWSIGLYTTKDFVNFYYYPYNPILTGSGDSNWDSVNAFKGAVSVFDGTYYLAYCGYDNSGNNRMGETTLTITTPTDSGSIVYIPGARSDFGDVRFTASDGSTLLPYCTVAMVTGTSATFFFKDADNLTSTSSTVYMYCGNSGATSAASSVDSIFVFGDDFLGSSINSTLWTVSGSPTGVSNGFLQVDNSAYVLSKTNFQYKAITFKATFSSSASGAAGLWDLANPANPVIELDANYPTSGYLIDLLSLEPMKGQSYWYTKTVGTTGGMHEYDIDWFNGQVQFYIDGTLEDNATTYVSSSSLPVFFGAWSSSLLISVDWVVVRNYVSSQPVITWGNEETPPNYHVTVTVVGQGSVSLNATGPYPSGAHVQLIANAAIGWSFDHWSSDLTGSANPTILTITGNMSVTATFTQPSIIVYPTSTNAAFGTDCTVCINVTNVQDLYAWEFQLNYNPAVLNLTSASIVPGGLNTPTQTFYDLVDKTNGHLWWAVSTVHPTKTGISYSSHTIFELGFHTKALGTSSLSLYGTILSNSTGKAMIHTVTNGTINVQGFIDLAVTGINIDNHGCSIYKNDTYANGSPYYYPVEVTIRNLGNLGTDAFYVKLEVYWTTGLLSEGSAEIYVPGLTAGASAVINFTSLFHPMHTRYYQLTATVDSRNNITEPSKANNTQVLSSVPVTVMGDVNGDGVVNILDAVIISEAWQGTPTSFQWNIRADINHDGVIDILDATRIGLHWGETW